MDRLTAIIYDLANGKNLNFFSIKDQKLYAKWALNEYSKGKENDYKFSEKDLEKVKELENILAI